MTSLGLIWNAERTQWYRQLELYIRKTVGVDLRSAHRIDLTVVGLNVPAMLRRCGCIYLRSAVMNTTLYCIADW
jgi:hypothetical protein